MELGWKIGEAITLGFLALLYLCFRYLVFTAKQHQKELNPSEEPEEVEKVEEAPSNEEIEAELLASGELSENEQLLAFLDPEGAPAETEAVSPKDSRENLKSLYQAGILSREEYAERLARMKEKR